MGRALLRRAWFPALLIGLTLGLYSPALRFSLLWDDPNWYKQGAGQTLWQLFTAPPGYQFYRPLTVWLNQQWVSPSGLVNAPLAHAFQNAVHLIAGLACVPALRALGIKKELARLAALIFVVSPFAYQAVAWQAPQQPLALMLVLLAVLAASRLTRHLGWAAVSMGLYAGALFIHESAVPFVFLFIWLAATQRPARRRWWPLAHIGLVCLYLFIWLNVPRVGGLTGQGWQLSVLAYLLQGVVFPAAALGAQALTPWPLGGLIGAFTALGAGLLWGAWKLHGWRVALFITLWIGAGLAPVWLALSWDYVQVGSRLLYPASLGIALLWAAWMTPLFDARATRWRRGLAGLLLAVVLAVCAMQWWSFHRLYQRGTAHLAQTVRVLSGQPGARLLFINYPDRIELRPAPYPLGVWGLTLAPVIQNLADYALATTGRSASDESRSAFLVGAAEREAWPYRVFMRGSDTPPAELFAAARQADAVYVTDYNADGSLALRAVGSVRPAPASAPVLAAFGEAAQLAEAHISDEQLQLVWTSLAPLREGDTIFVHLWKDGVFIASADGDSLGGVLPPAAWQPGAQIVDERTLAVPGLAPGVYEVRVGLYSRWDNTRTPARAAAGQRFPDDEVPVGSLTLP